METLRGYLDFAVEVCEKAGKIALEYFQSDMRIETKSDGSPVTIADRTIEKMIRESIESRFPNHAIIGEEFGAAPSSSDHKWFIDPIDGTKAYSQGVPIFGVMLGLEVKDEMVVGVVNLPALQEMVYAAKGEGCKWNGRTARVSNTSDLKSALLTIAGEEYFTQYGLAETLEKLREAVGWIRTWGDCYGHILVATGRSDLCVDPILNPWDVAALVPILYEAGGTCTDWHGKVNIYSPNGVSTNNELLCDTIRITHKSV
ncbi:MAG: histidinol phosphate phosphatase [Acidobacteria bacterium]|nr:MAG: histidinol phosphate phosphatase [Acidobacteriota bacterium]